MANDEPVNIWGLDKQGSIKRLLLLLQHQPGYHLFYLRDTDGLDHRAVRIGSPHTPATAYLYTYGQDSERYGLHLEYPDNGEINAREMQAIYEDLCCDQVTGILGSHLQLDEQHGGGTR